jgi:hypothetical protein
MNNSILFGLIAIFSALGFWTTDSPEIMVPLVAVTIVCVRMYVVNTPTKTDDAMFDSFVLFTKRVFPGTRLSILIANIAGQSLAETDTGENKKS